jgi:N-acetylglutamate synthase
MGPVTRVDVDNLELACALAWPAVVDRPLGQWRLRAAGGFTGRANSALTIGSPDRSIPAALRAVRAFAEEHEIQPATHVVTGSRLEPALALAGWTVDTEHPGGASSLVLTGALAGLARTVRPRLPGIAVADRVSADWWPLGAGTPDPSPAQRHVLTSGALVGFGRAVTAAGAVVGVVRGAVVGELLHIARLAVDPAHRRTGLATGLLHALADWADANGATRYALQVAEHNAAAITLYTGLGATRHHGYRYWIPGPRLPAGSVGSGSVG